MHLIFATDIIRQTGASFNKALKSRLYPNANSTLRFFRTVSSALRDYAGSRMPVSLFLLTRRIPVS